MKRKVKEELVHLTVKRSVAEEVQRIAELLGTTTAQFVENILVEYINNFEEPEDYNQEQQETIDRDEILTEHLRKIIERFQYIYKR